jgi:hypothetical protein
MPEKAWQTGYTPPLGLLTGIGNVLAGVAIGLHLHRCGDTAVVLHLPGPTKLSAVGAG